MRADDIEEWGFDGYGLTVQILESIALTAVLGSRLRSKGPRSLVFADQPDARAGRKACVGIVTLVQYRRLWGHLGSLAGIPTH